MSEIDLKRITPELIRNALAPGSVFFTEKEEGKSELAQILGVNETEITQAILAQTLMVGLRSGQFKFETGAGHVVQAENTV